MKILQFARNGLNLLSIAALAVIVFASVELLAHPATPADWVYNTGEVFRVEGVQSGPDELRVGDIILSIDGLPPSEALSFMGKSVGDQVVLEVIRNGEVLQMVIEMTRAGAGLLWSRFVPVLIAVTFWFFAVLILFFARYSPETGMVTLFLLLMSLTLSLGSISAVSGRVITWSYVVARLVVGPVALITHIIFPSSEEVRVRKSFTFLLFGFTLALLIFSFTRPSLAMDIVSTPAFIWLLCNLLITVWVVGKKYLKAPSAAVRRKTGVISLALTISLLTFTLTTILPEILFSKPVLPYEISMLSLFLIPAGYGFAVFQNKLIHLERVINRSAAIILMTITLAGLYVLAYFLLLLALPAEVQNPLLWGVAITLLLTLVSPPLFTTIDHAVDRFLYGGGYDRFSVVHAATRSLSDAENDLENLAMTLCKSLCFSMKLDFVHFLLDTGQLMRYSAREGCKPVNTIETVTVEDICSRLSGNRGMDVKTIRAFLGEGQITSQDEKMLLGERPSLVYPLCEKNNPQDVLVLGGKLGDEPFTKADMDILDVIVHQTSISIQNIKNLQQIEKMHYRLLQTREEERKMIARDLHDRTIQSLIGVNYSLNTFREYHSTEDGENIRTVQLQIRETIDDLRRICTELRPQTLDLFGLLPAMRARIEELQPDLPFKIELLVTGDEQQEFPEAVAFALYRVFQETIMNIRKHAKASLAVVMLRIGSSKVELEIWDDGQGFDVPKNLKIFSLAQHFGLVGIQEVVEAVSGKFSIRSHPDDGCSVSAVIPIKKAADPGG